MDVSKTDFFEEPLVRDALPEDAPAIARLNREEMGYEYPEEQTMEKLRALLSSGRDKILVAECSGTVVGYVHLCNYELI